MDYSSRGFTKIANVAVNQQVGVQQKRLEYISRGSSTAVEVGVIKQRLEYSSRG